MGNTTFGAELQSEALQGRIPCRAVADSGSRAPVYPGAEPTVATTSHMPTRASSAGVPVPRASRGAAEAFPVALFVIAGMLSLALPGVAHAGTSAVPRTPSTPGVRSGASGNLVPQGGSGYHPIEPTRILDTRKGSPLPNDGGKGLDVTEQGGVSGVPDSADAVVMNVTVTEPTANSYVSVGPYKFGPYLGGGSTSSLNFGVGETIANLVTVRTGTWCTSPTICNYGGVSLYNHAGTVHVIADIVGYYDRDGAGDLFTGLNPTRLLDSRTSNGGWNAKLNVGAPRDLTVRQPGNATGVPATATAVIANVTVTGATAGSFVSVWPSGVTQPNVSNINFAAGQTIPNLAIIKIGSNGAIRFANAVGGVDVIVDVVGYFDPTGGSWFHSLLQPTRVLDDRANNGLNGPWGAGQTRALPVAGAAGTNVPPGATGLVANVTATAGTKGSFLTVFPDGVPVPNSSNVNFGPGQTIPNMVTVKIAANGSIDFYNQLGTVDVIADAVGYYAGT